ncbi:WXG100 family type VII secretion target [Nocardia sp. NPDC101769]|uniref:WXG100 family type VII secretion target n=1 Tax=Nocardia sp. NPDC101769 TaxID=3364333 RepID=UPI0038290BDD
MALLATPEQMRAIAKSSGEDHTALIAEISQLETAQTDFMSSFQGEAGDAAVQALAQTIETAKNTAKDLEQIIDHLDQAGYKIGAVDQTGLDELRRHGGVDKLAPSKVDLSAI